MIGLIKGIGGDYCWSFLGTKSKVFAIENSIIHDDFCFQNAPEVYLDHEIVVLDHKNLFEAHYSALNIPNFVFKNFDFVPRNDQQ